MGLGIGEIVKVAQDSLAPVGNTLGDAWQIVLGDRFAAWRLTNAAKIQVKVNEQVQALGLKLNTAKIPERYALAWFEEATKQDEDEIQTLFAKLLAKASAGDEDALDRRHIGILTQMTPSDARAFKTLCESPGFWDLPDDRNELIEYLTNRRWDERYIGPFIEPDSYDKRMRSIEHLNNIGLLDKETHVEVNRYRSMISTEKSTGIPDLKYDSILQYKLTRLGASFYFASR